MDIGSLLNHSAIPMSNSHSLCPVKEKFMINIRIWLLSRLVYFLSFFMGDNFCDFLFVFCANIPSEKGSTLFASQVLYFYMFFYIAFYA